MEKLKKKLYIIIFGTDTKAGKLFDIVILWLILISVISVVIGSVENINTNYGDVLTIIEWIVTIVFTIEYILRIYTSPKKLKYIFSFYGLIDLISILPTYLSLVASGPQFLLTIRSIRLLRVFRILKLSRYITEAQVLGDAISRSLHKITVFFGVVLTLVLILGTMMYLVEGAENGFTSIPESIYWSIVTITTVGYGDIAPQTFLGKTIASIIMLLGYSIIAIPTGIMSAELAKTESSKQEYKVCSDCGYTENDTDAKFCKKCGNELDKVV